MSNDLLPLPRVNYAPNQVMDGAREADRMVGELGLGWAVTYCNSVLSISRDGMTLPSLSYWCGYRARLQQIIASGEHADSAFDLPMVYRCVMQRPNGYIIVLNKADAFTALFITPEGELTFAADTEYHPAILVTDVPVLRYEDIPEPVRDRMLQFFEDAEDAEEDELCS